MLTEPLAFWGLAFTRWTAHQCLLCWPKGYDAAGGRAGSQVRGRGPS